MLLALALWLGVAIFLWAQVVWPGYSPFIMNDGDTPLYTSYAVNLANCPLGTTHGMMMNAVGPDCLPLLVDDQPAFYLDHPSGMAWWVRLALPLFDSPVLAARVVNLAFAAGIVLLCSILLYQRLGLVAGLGVLLGSFCVSLFWWHSVIVNLQAATSFFSVLCVYAFMRYDDRRDRRWLALSLAAFVLAAVTDWPAYFIAGPIGLYLLYQRRFGVFAIYFVAGTGMMISTFLYFSGINLGFNRQFDTGHFFSATFLTQFSDQRPAYLMSNGAAILQSFDLIRSSFSRLGTVLLLLPLIMLLWGRGRKALSPLTLFIACFATQGLLNQLLFFHWAASHNYWNYYYLPVVLVGAGIALNWLWRKAGDSRVRQLAVAGLVCVVLLGAYKGMKPLWRQYATPPGSIEETLASKDLADVLNPDFVLLAPDATPYWGQGFKLRLDIPRQLQPLSRAAEYGCDKAFTIYKASSLTPEQKAAQAGIHIEEFDWYVIKGNPENPACR